MRQETLKLFVLTVTRRSYLLIQRMLDCQVLEEILGKKLSGLFFRNLRNGKRILVKRRGFLGPEDKELLPRIALTPYATNIDNNNSNP